MSFALTMALVVAIASAIVVAIAIANPHCYFGCRSLEAFVRAHSPTTTNPIAVAAAMAKATALTRARMRTLVLALDMVKQNILNDTGEHTNCISKQPHHEEQLRHD